MWVCNYDVIGHSVVGGGAVSIHSGHSHNLAADTFGLKHSGVNMVPLRCFGDNDVVCRPVFVGFGLLCSLTLFW